MNERITAHSHTRISSLAHECNNVTNTKGQSSQPVVVDYNPVISALFANEMANFS